MPEYLAPGVYVEEVSFRSKSIQGVPTSTTGFAGMTRFGPVQYNDGGVRHGPSTSEPRLVTSFTEFERIYGGLEPLTPDGIEQPCYLAHAARAYHVLDEIGTRPGVTYLKKVVREGETKPAAIKGHA